MSESLERTVGNVIVAILSNDATLAALPPLYAITDELKESPMVRVSATKGEKQYEGPGGFLMDVVISVRSNEEDADQLDDICARVDAAMETPDTTGVDVSALSVFIIEFQQSGEWSIEQDSRERTRSYPCIVKAA